MKRIKQSTWLKLFAEDSAKSETLTLLVNYFNKSTCSKKQSEPTVRGTISKLPEIVRE